MSGQTFDAGLPVIAEDLTNIVYQNDDGISGQATSSGTDTTTSSSYVNMAGTGSTTSFTFTKALAATRVKVTIHAGVNMSVATSQVRMGVNVNSTDYDCVQDQIVSGEFDHISGFAYISGLAAGAYTIQGRWKRTSGTGTPGRGPNEWLAICAAEVT